MTSPRERPIVVLDDDPTGVQTLAGVRVLLSWDAQRVRTALEGRPRRAPDHEQPRARAGSCPRPRRGCVAHGARRGSRRASRTARGQHVARPHARGVPGRPGGRRAGRAGRCSSSFRLCRRRGASPSAACTSRARRGAGTRLRDRVRARRRRSRTGARGSSTGPRSARTGCSRRRGVARCPLAELRRDGGAQRSPRRSSSSRGTVSRPCSRRTPRRSTTSS